MPTPTLADVQEAVVRALRVQANSDILEDADDLQALGERLHLLADNVTVTESWEVQGRVRADGPDAPWRSLSTHTDCEVAEAWAAINTHVWEYRLVPVQTLTAHVSGPAVTPAHEGSEYNLVALVAAVDKVAAAHSGEEPQP